MEEKEFKRKDGSEGVEYKLEAGDIVEAMFGSIRKSDERLGVNKKTGKPFKTRDYSLGVKFDDKDIYVKLTKTQAETLEKEGNLLGKKIEAYEYEHPKWGPQIGVKVEG